MKILKNKWVRVIVAVLAALLVVYFAVVAKLAWDGYQKQAAIDRFQESMERPFREDVYGGKTPEETWAMFLDALKKEDFELASKYYDVEHQTEARKKLEKSKKLGRIKKVIENFSSKRMIEEKKLSRQNRKYYYIPIENSLGETEAYPVVFYLNPYTKVWKIIW